MRVLYFGTYQRAYPRNAQVISCLRGAGVEVDERNVDVWDVEGQEWKAGPREAIRLLAAEAKLFARRPNGYDAVLVGYPGHLDLPAAKRAGKPVVFNPLVSLGDSFVSDRGRFRPGSLPARVLTTIDARAFRSADVVVADTKAHAQFFAELGGLERVEVCFVGAEDRLFRPGWVPTRNFEALFVGKLIPLQGVETIITAAELDPDIPFRIVGSGQLEDLLADRPVNVEHVPWVKYELLSDELHRAGCALGIFGTGAKAQRVIPNKAFQALACGTPLITGDTPAARELLVDDESALLVPTGDPEALAEAIRRLADDDELARRIGAGGRAAYEAQASEAVLGPRWREIIERLL
jgi:glycosyltransferase involved in cell wall biosynthesis